VNALTELERAGYEFSLEDNGTVRYTFRGAEQPDASFIRPRLAVIRQHRQELAAILSARAATPPIEEVFTNKTRRWVVFPADTKLAFPAGTWRRLEDGRIEAHLNYDDLKTMRMWRDEILS
jgi:hypothetical protein